VQIIPRLIGFCIVQSPASLSVVTNDRSFHVVAQGAGPFTYNATCGNNLPGATSSVLFIPSAGVAKADLHGQG